MEYPIVVVPLTEEDGGGFAAYVLDLPGCMSDGDTPEKALRNARKAIVEWRAQYEALGRKVPAPGSAAIREQREKATLRRDLANALKSFERMDERVETLAKTLADISERLELLDKRTRFFKLTGLTPQATRSSRSTKASALC